ncbi:transposase Tra5, partial [Yersinia pestis PY-55]
MLCRQRQAYR